jgi:hypothetical protein
MNKEIKCYCGHTMTCQCGPLETKQTAIEWLFQRFEDGDMYNVEDAKFIKHQAKIMEKEQIVDAHIEGQRVFDNYEHTQWTTDQAEQYYNETYKGGQDA